MKYNQYAYVETDFDQQVKELIDINFLPKNYADWNFNDLLDCNNFFLKSL